MRTPAGSHSHVDDRPPEGKLVLFVVVALVGGICFGAILDRALWATEQSKRPLPPPAIVQCPAPLPCPALEPAKDCPAVNVCPGCPPCRAEGGVPLPGEPLPLGGTLWLVSSAGWDGYVDFRGDGVYSTHWGLGRWELRGDDVLTMQNSYDGFGFELRVRDGKLSGRRSDGSSFVGSFASRYGR